MLRSAAVCLLCSLLCECYVIAAQLDFCFLGRLPISIFVGACAVLLVMSMPKSREPVAPAAQEVLAATVSICVVVGYFATLCKPIYPHSILFVADALQPLLKKWWPTPKLPPPPEPWWCSWTFQVVHQYPVSVFFIDAWKDKCIQVQVDWHVKDKIDDMMEWWVTSLTLGYIMTSIVFFAPLMVFRDIANSFAKKHNFLYSKFSANDKRKMCLGIVTWACFLSILPAIPNFANRKL